MRNLKVNIFVESTKTFSGFGLRNNVREGRLSCSCLLEFCLPFRFAGAMAAQDTEDDDDSVHRGDYGHVQLEAAVARLKSRECRFVVYHNLFAKRSPCSLRIFQGSRGFHPCRPSAPSPDFPVQRCNVSRGNNQDRCRGVNLFAPCTVWRFLP